MYPLRQAAFARMLPLPFTFSVQAFVNLADIAALRAACRVNRTRIRLHANRSVTRFTSDRDK
jgi:hypothetical protein